MLMDSGGEHTDHLRMGPQIKQYQKKKKEAGNDAKHGGNVVFDTLGTTTHDF